LPATEPLSVRPIPESLPADIKTLLAKLLSILRTDDVVPKPLGQAPHSHRWTPPVFAKALRLEPDKVEIAKAEFKRMEAAGIVSRSTSPWASPLHMVPRKDGSWRPCGDYGLLNMVTAPEKNPLPNMQDLSNSLHNCKNFSKIDLIKGYHQIPVVT
jgi:hypothetical protein